MDRMTLAEWTRIYSSCVVETMPTGCKQVFGVKMHTLAHLDLYSLADWAVSSHMCGTFILCPIE